MKAFVQVLKTLIPIVLAVIIIYLAFRNVDFVEFWSNIGEVDYRWVVLSILLSLVGYVARAYRWNILLEPLGNTPRLYNTTLAVLVGYLANIALPRLGEVVRCTLLFRTDKLPVDNSLGTVISERLVDMLALLILIFGALILEFELLSDFLSGYGVGGAFGWFYWAAGIAFVLGLALFITMLYLFRRGFFPKLRAFLRGLLDGLLSIRHIRRKWQFVVSTVLIWVIYYLMSYTIVFALPATAHLDVIAGLMLLVTAGIAISLPVQAGFGTYHAMIAGLLLVYGIPEVTGLFVATLLHTSQIVAVAIFGGMALLLSLFVRPTK